MESDVSPAEEISAEKPKSKLRTIVLETLQTVILALLFYLVISLATARVVVEGPSMRPTLLSGEWIVVNRLTYKFSSPNRGDVVVFLPPTNAQTDDLIKRVIGLPGELLEIRDGSVWINGRLLEESYISASTTPDNRWQLATDEIFVMGDNRGLSLDSRSFGPVSISEVVGKAWIIYWPPSEWGLVDWRSGAVESSDDPAAEGAFRYNILIRFADGGCLWPSRPDAGGWSLA